MLACINDQSEVVDVLLEAGADVNQYSRVSITYEAKFSENGPRLFPQSSISEEGQDQ